MTIQHFRENIWGVMYASNQIIVVFWEHWPKPVLHPSHKRSHLIHCFKICDSSTVHMCLYVLWWALNIASRCYAWMKDASGFKLNQNTQFNIEQTLYLKTVRFLPCRHTKLANLTKNISFKMHYIWFSAAVLGLSQTFINIVFTVQYINKHRLIM